MIEDIFARFGLPPSSPPPGVAGAVEPPGAFPLPANRFLTRRERREKKDQAKKNNKRFIKPENARTVVPHLPLEDERTHCIVRGDFVFADLIPAIIDARGNCSHLRVSSLSINPENVTTICRLVDSGAVGRFDLLLSHYFLAVNGKTPKWTIAKEELTERGRPCVMGCARTHAKVILIPTASGDWYSIEGSGNLRASNNIEQFVITNDRETYDFHASWMDELLADHSPSA